MAACSSSSSSSGSRSIEITDLPGEVLYKIASSGLGDADVARLAATCMTLYQKTETLYLRSMARHDCGFPEIPPYIQTRDEHAKILKLRKSGGPVLDLKKCRELDNAKIIGQASYWLMYQHQDDSYKRMNLHNGETKELWTEISSIIDDEEYFDADRWVFHSTLDRLIVAMKLPSSDGKVYSADTFDARIKVVSTHPSINPCVIKTAILKQWESIGESQPIGIWEGENNTLIVATQYGREDEWTIKVGVFDIINGDFLYGKTLPDTSVRFSKYNSSPNKHLLFDFDPNGNSFRFLSKTSRREPGSMYGFIHTIFMKAHFLPREKYYQKERDCKVLDRLVQSREFDLPKIKMFLAGSKTYVLDDINRLFEINREGLSSRILGRNSLAFPAITKLGDRVLVINLGGSSCILDSSEHKTDVDLLPDAVPVSYLAAAGCTIVVQQKGYIQSAAGFFTDQPVRGGVIRAYTWIK